ncbi:M50 family metallopeptidase [Brevibacillus fulvus]|uniref:Stage IV sporulation protein FB n=2 Tax=Brevibacillus fulvus TaxID=1125967 RepID=A0A938Y0Z0_9BACL|nr:M50 family metallopeptidase [Brevibacillus fulvus]MBM7590016.1 stage IV sporulation protein FB [Brevibacillus fulvus]
MWVRLINEWLPRIRIRIHLLFWVVIGLSFVTGNFTEIMTLFVIVIIHEMGHVAAATELGWTVSEIKLLPFGGVATVEEAVASQPLDEIIMAVAGPFMNVTMILLAQFLWWAGIWSADWAEFFITSNWIIAGFNLLPIWPLDGGRIVQALLCYLWPYGTAARFSLGTSVVFAAVMLGLGCFFLNPNLVMLAVYLLFINMQAFIRFPYQFIRFLMEKYIAGQEHLPLRSVSLSPDVTVKEAAEQLRRGSYHLFLIRGPEGGLLAEEQLLEAVLFQHQRDIAVSRLL